MTNPPAIRGLPGRKVLVACGCLVVLLAGTAGYVMIAERPRGGAYLDALALDGDFVVAIREERTRGRAFIEMVDAQQGLRWQALVPGYRVPDGAIGVAASDHAITARFPRDGRTQIFGFAPATSQKLGTVILGDELRKEPDGHLSTHVATIGAGTDAFEVLEPDTGPTRVYDVSLRHGVASWHRDLPTRGVEAAWVTARSFVVEQPGHVTALARDGSEPTSWDADTACVTVGGTLVIGAGGQVTAIDLDDQARRGIAAGDFAGLCGRRGPALVVAMDRPARLVFDDGAELALGSARFAVAATRINASQATPFADELSRHEVVQLDDGRLVGVDLDARTIAWTAAAAPGAVLIAAGARVLWRDGDDLVSIDPTNGDALAVQAPGTRPLRAHHVAGGGVWLIGDHGLVELDVGTLTPRGRWKRAPAVNVGKVPWR